MVFTKRIKNKLYETIEYAWVWTLIQTSFLPSKEVVGLITLFTFYLPFYLLINFCFWIHSTLQSCHHKTHQTLNLLLRGPAYRNLCKYCHEKGFNSYLLEEVNIGLHYDNGRLEFFDLDKSFKKVGDSHSSIYRYVPHYVKWSHAKELFTSHRIALLTSPFKTTREIVKFFDKKCD